MRIHFLLPLATSTLGLVPTQAQSPSCNSLELSSFPSYVTVPASAALAPANLTVEAWIQVDQNNPIRGTIARKNPATGRDAWNLRIEAGRLRFYARRNTVLTWAESIAIVPTDVPIHVAATYDGTLVQLYVNGLAAGSRTTLLGPIADTGGELRIGQGDGSPDEQFYGKIDELRIWNTARTPAEIATNQRRILNKATNEVASYSFDNDFQDSTGSHHGSKVGQPSFAASAYDFSRLTQHGKGSATGGEFAGNVASLGDINGDGFEDYAVGHGLDSSSAFMQNSGSLLCYSGRDHSLLLSQAGLNSQDRFGWHTDGGDLDGDGYSDVLVGAPGYRLNSGAIYAISGKTKAMRLFAASKFLFSAGQFGMRVLAVPYLDADGLCDVVTVESDRLIAFDAKGNNMWEVTMPDRQRVASLDVIGDIDADGSDDLIVGLPDYNNNGKQAAGRVQVHSGRTGSAIAGLSGDVAGMWLGLAVCGIHADVTGDKIPDAVFSAPRAFNNAGALYLFDGGMRSFRQILAGSAGQELGLALCAAEGDLNGDGIWDVRSTAKSSGNGRVYEVDMKAFKLGAYLQGGSTSPDFGSSIVGLETNGRPKADALIAERDVAARLWDNCPVDVAPVHLTYGATCDGTNARRPRLAVIDKSGLRVNGSYTMRVSSARPSSAIALQLGIGRVDVPLDAIGMKGCKYLLGQSLVTSTRPIDGNGIAELTFIVPDAVTLMGIKVNFQALCLDLAANSFNLTASNGAEIVVGTRL